MRKLLELGESRVSAIDIVGEDVVVSFSHAYLRQNEGANGLWIQEAEILFRHAVVEGDVTGVPGTVAEGFMESGGRRHEHVPLPFHRRGPAVLFLGLENGGSITVRGEAPDVDLLGEAIHLEDY